MVYTEKHVTLQSDNRILKNTISKHSALMEHNKSLRNLLLICFYHQKVENVDKNVGKGILTFYAILAFSCNYR